MSADAAAGEPTTTRAVTIDAPGGLEVLGVGRRHVRAPGQDEVRIAVRASAVNPTDALLRASGVDGVPPPWTPGMDAAGTIESIGSGVQRLRVGDPVMAVVGPRRREGGAQAELVVVPAASVVPIPRGATLEQASTLPMNGMTALLALERLDLRAGQTLAVTGGAGMLASYAIPLAKARDLEVLADAKPADEPLVRGFGADVVVPRGSDFATSVREAAPDGVDGLLDAALLGRPSLAAVRDGGTVILVRPGLDVPEERGIRAHSIVVSQTLERTDWLEELREAASDGRLKLRVAAELPPEDVAEAQRITEAGGLRGRVVIVF